MKPRGRTNPVPHILTSEVVLGRRSFIAAYEPDPSIAFRAATADEALRQLDAHMSDVHDLLAGTRFPMPRAQRPGSALR